MTTNEIIATVTAIALIPYTIVLIKLWNAILRYREKIDRCDQDCKYYSDKLAEIRAKAEEVLVKEDMRRILNNFYNELSKGDKYNPYPTIDVDNDGHVRIHISDESTNRYIENKFTDELRKYEQLVNDRYEAGYLQGVFDHAAGTFTQESLNHMRADLRTRLNDSTTKRYDKPLRGILS